LFSPEGFHVRDAPLARHDRAEGVDVVHDLSKPVFVDGVGYLSGVLVGARQASGMIAPETTVGTRMSASMSVIT